MNNQTNKTEKKAIVIGAGLSSLACACMLAKDGFEVTVIEKNDRAGGRAGLYQKDGFRFDLGPSWYWMPEVFEEFFGLFNKKTSDYFDLLRIDPSYKVIFKDGELDMPIGQKSVENLFESLETGAGAKLNKYLRQAKYKYDLGMNSYAKKPSLSWTEFLDPRLAVEAVRMSLFESFGKQVRRQFKHPWLREILYFPTLFLGSTPDNTPALYSLMNYGDLVLGTWYPKNKNSGKKNASGGIYELILAMQSLAIGLGVKFVYNEPVEQILTKKVASHEQTAGVKTSKAEYLAHIVVSGADYQHTEQKLLPAEFRRYDDKYWDSRVMCPSSLLFYVGLDIKLPNLLHHNLFFDRDFGLHATEIYDQPKPPTDPLMYVCLASKTDLSCAPVGGENLFVLIPTAPGLTDMDIETVKQKYWAEVVERLKQKTGVDITDHIKVFRSFAHHEFVNDYNSFKGNAYGLANTLMQTAIFKPKLKSKLPGFYFTGQLTAPGPGMPTCVMSGQIVAGLIQKEYANKSKN